MAKKIKMLCVPYTSYEIRPDRGYPANRYFLLTAQDKADAFAKEQGSTVKIQSVNPAIPHYSNQ